MYPSSLTFDNVLSSFLPPPREEIKGRIRVVPLRDLLPHEQVLPERLALVRKSIVGSGVVYQPVIVDRDSMLVIDGHHRIAALRSIGARYAPVILVDYYRDVERVRITRALPLDDPYGGLRVLARLAARGFSVSGLNSVFGVDVDPGLVVEVASSIGVLPAKTTNHLTWAKGVYAYFPVSDLF